MDYFEIIEQYKQKNLPEPLMKEFMAEMEKDITLKKAIENHDVASDIFDFLIEEDIRKQLRIVIDSIGEPVEERSPLYVVDKKSEPGSGMIAWLGHYKTQLSAAAAVLTISIAAVFLFNTNENNSSPESLFASYYSSYPNLESPSRAAIDYNDIKAVREAAYKAYDNENFEEFITILTNITPGYAQQDNDAFYLGIANLELGLSEKAVTLFEYVTESNSEYKNDGFWYLGLAYLRMKDCDKARDLLIPIRDAGLDRSAEAGQILDKMKC